MQCAHLIGKVLFLHTLHEHHQSLQSRPPGKAQVLSKLLTIKKIKISIRFKSQDKGKHEDRFYKIDYGP